MWLHETKVIRLYRVQLNGWMCLQPTILALLSTVRTGWKQKPIASSTALSCSWARSNRTNEKFGFFWFECTFPMPNVHQTEPGIHILRRAATAGNSCGRGYHRTASHRPPAFPVPCLDHLHPSRRNNCRPLLGPFRNQCVPFVTNASRTQPVGR
jgi:hypothetical protein